MADCVYACKHYNVPAQIGRRVVVDGRPGAIAEDRGAYIGVLFDDDPPNMIRPCHPTWMVEYGEMGKVRKMTRAQQRYAEYRKNSDCFDSFRGFLQYCTERARAAKEGVYI